MLAGAVMRAIGVLDDAGDTQACAGAALREFVEE